MGCVDQRADKTFPVQLFHSSLRVILACIYICDITDFGWVSVLTLGKETYPDREQDSYLTQVSGKSAY